MSPFRSAKRCTSNTRARCKVLSLFLPTNLAKAQPFRKQHAEHTEIAALPARQHLAMAEYFGNRGMIGDDLWQKSSGSCKNDLKSNINLRERDTWNFYIAKRTASEIKNSDSTSEERDPERDTSDSLPTTHREKISRSKTLVTRIRAEFVNISDDDEEGTRETTEKMLRVTVSQRNRGTRRGS